MNSNRNYVIFLEDMIDCMEKIQEYIGDLSYEEFTTKNIDSLRFVPLVWEVSAIHLHLPGRHILTKPRKVHDSHLSSTAL